MKKIDILNKLEEIKILVKEFNSRLDKEGPNVISEASKTRSIAESLKYLDELDKCYKFIKSK